jgi:hypothetical protein
MSYVVELRGRLHPGHVNSDPCEDFIVVMRALQSRSFGGWERKIIIASGDTKGYGVV